MSITELLLKTCKKDVNARRGGVGRCDENGQLHGKNLTVDTFDSEQKGDRRPLTIERDKNGKLLYRYCVREEVFNHGKRTSAIVYLKDGRSVEFLDGTFDHPEVVEAESRSIAFSEEVVSSIAKYKNSTKNRMIEEDFIRDLQNASRDL